MKRRSVEARIEARVRERLDVPDRVLMPAAFLVACGLIVSRRPDAMTHAQFFVEDGAVWYAQAHELGCLRPLLSPYRGYLVLAQRLAACVALGVPLAHAPLVMNLLAIGCEALTAAFLCSRRLGAVLPNVWLRVGLGLLYVGLPAMWGTMTSVTMAQWHLAVLACAVVVAAPDLHLAWRVFDVLAVAASGLSGPFAIFLVPVIAVKWYLRRERRLVPLGVITAACAIVQAGALLLTRGQPDGDAPFGASLSTFLRVVVGRTVYGFLLGQTGYGRIFADPNSPWLHLPVLVPLGLALSALVGYAVVRGPLELKLFVAFAAMILAAALIFPSPAPPGQAAWWALTAPGASNRYFLIPMLALGIVFVWLSARRSIAARAAGIAVLACAAVFGVARDWREPPPLDYDFPRFAAKYERVPAGTRVHIPYPTGWTMVLTKR